MPGLIVWLGQQLLQTVRAAAAAGGGVCAAAAAAARTACMSPVALNKSVSSPRV
jgi:hypothetical protein